MNNKFTEILIIQDRSGSMSGVVEGTITGFNTFLRKQKEVDGEANLSLVQFDDQYEVPLWRKDIKQVPDLTTETYQPRGMTALFDAVCRSIDDLGAALAATPEEHRPFKVIVIIQTDGFENSSKFKLPDVQERIKHQQEKYGWEFMFFGANIDAIATATLYNIPASNSAGYTGSVGTTAGVYMAASNASIRSRSMGMSVALNAAEVQALQTDQAVPDVVSVTTTSTAGVVVSPDTSANP